MASSQRRAAARTRTLEFMRAMWALDHALNRVSKQMATRLGVTAPQRLVVRMLGERREATPGALAEILHLHPSTLTGVLQRLERNRLIRRSTAAGDRRRSHLELTPRGVQVNAERAGTVEDAVARTLDRIPAAEVDITIRVLGELAATLRDIFDGPQPVDGHAAASRPPRRRRRNHESSAA
jgi:DNA-binding MarR family transcriptional regulator